jgi:hypothetical protein
MKGFLVMIDAAHVVLAGVVERTEKERWSTLGDLPLTGDSA